MKTTLCTVVSLAALLLFASACNQGVESYSVPKSGAPAPEQHAHDAPGGGAAELVWTVPEGWVSAGSSSMRLANFQVPAGGEGSECYVMILGGQAGGLVANVNRWRGQIGLPVLGNAEILSSAKELTGALGTFHVFRLENPAAPDRALLAAILPLQGETAFVKLNAPIENLDKVEPAFLEFSASLGLGSK